MRGTSLEAEIGGYEHLLNIQQHQHALALEQKDAEIAHMKARMLASEEEAPLPESLVAVLQTKDEECALMMAAKHKELEFLASLLQMREHQIEDLQPRSLGASPWHDEDVSQEVLKEVQRLRLRMEELEAAVTEQQDRCNGLASELQIKAEHVQALEQYIRSLKADSWRGRGYLDGHKGHGGAGNENQEVKNEVQDVPQIETSASPSPSSQVESYSSVRRDEPEDAGTHSGRQSQELLREMRRLRQQMNELERAAGREGSGLVSPDLRSFNFVGEPIKRQAEEVDSSLPAKGPRPVLEHVPKDALSGWEYRAHHHDPVDAAVAELVNGRYRPWRALLCRLEQGVYLCGTRRVRIRVDSAHMQLEASEDGETWADLAEVMGAKTPGFA